MMNPDPAALAATSPSVRTHARRVPPRDLLHPSLAEPAFAVTDSDDSDDVAPEEACVADDDLDGDQAVGDEALADDRPVADDAVLDDAALDDSALDDAALDDAALDDAALDDDALGEDVEAGDPFADIPAPIASALRERGFTSLTRVQRAVLGACADSHDLRLSSQTGSGKTVAIGLALAPRLIADLAADGPRRNGPAILVIAPTRELADQVRNELDWLFANVPGASTECVTGGTSVPQERRRLSRRPCIVVGTPGRLLDHVTNGALDLGGVHQLVLDEADQMLDMGFREELDAILATLPAERRTHMVSATFPPEVLEFVDRYQSEPMAVEGSSAGVAHADIEHIACRVGGRDRYAALVNLLLMGGDEKVLVFVRTRQDTATLAEQLANDGFSALPLSGDLAQAMRTRTLNAFRNGMVTTLVATDVAARGIDVSDVAMVVQFDPPVDGAVYVHRAGRTGRAGNKGRSVIMVAPASERRLDRMLQQQGIDASWREAPSPKVVLAAIDARERARLAAVFAAPAADDAERTARLRDDAQQLLDGRDPADVVARLLAMVRVEPPRQPIEIATTPARRVAARAPSFERERPQRATEYARFAINWGARSGATPKRVLAHVCRRGGIAGHQVGAIDLDAFSATFDVDASVAARFADRARLRDAREPHLVIRALGAPRRSRG